MLSVFLFAASAAPPILDVDPSSTRKRIPWAGGEREWIEQAIQGVPVERGAILVKRDLRGRVRSVSGERIEAPESLLPTLSSSQAVERVRLPGRGALWRPRTELVVWPSEPPRLAWAVDASTAAPVATWRVLVDAMDGTVLHGRRTSFSAEADVYPENPANSDLETVELLGLHSGEVLTGDYADAWSCDEHEVDEGLFGISLCHSQSRHALPDDHGDYRFGPDPAGAEDPLAEVLVYHHTDRVARYFDERFGFRIPPITVNVNFPMTNAFYGDFDGDGVPDLSFGHSEDGVDFAYDADVVYHEFGHALISGISQVGSVGADEYGMVWTAGSLNEGTADAVTMFLTGDPALAEYAGAYGGQEGPLRDLSTPRTCPEALAGEVHKDGELWGSLVWQLYSDPVVGPELTEDLVYGAASSWRWDVDWRKAGRSLLDAAEELRDEGLVDDTVYDAVAGHVFAANLLDCGRVMSLDEGASSTQLLLNGGLYGDFALIPLGMQFSLTVPEGHDRLVLEISEQSHHVDRLGFTVFVRKGTHVEHRQASFSGLGLAVAVPDRYDRSVEGSGDFTWELAAADLAIEPGETYYFAVSGRNLGGIDLLDFTRAWITIRGRTEAALPLDEEESPRAACGCQQSGSSWLGLWALAGLAGICRRRSKA